MEVILLRHGATEGNAQRRYIGRTDEPLSDAGLTALQALPPLPQLRRVFVTPLLRTQQTAAVLFPKAVQTIVTDLREMDFGDFEGRNADELAHSAAYRRWVEGGCIAPTPNGETRQDFSRRCCEAFQATLRTIAEDGEPTGVFVLHGGSIMAILERFAQPQREFYAYQVPNGGGFQCEAACIEPLVLRAVRRI